MKKLKIEHYTLGLIIFFIIGSIIYIKMLKSEIIKNGRLVDVKIVYRLSGGKGMNNAVYNCEFYIDGKLKRSSSTTRIEDNKDFYIGKFYPALYLETRNFLKLLITPDDFEEYNIQFPDSLIRRIN